MSILGRYNIGAFKAATNPDFADLLPWTIVLNDEQTVLLKDGSFMATWKVRGPDMESAPDHDYNTLCRTLSSAISSLQSGWSVFFEDTRRLTKEYEEAEYTHGTASIIDAERRTTFQADNRFENHYFLSVTFLPPPKTHSLFKKYLIAGQPDDTTDDFAPRLRDFQNMLRALEQSFQYIFKTVVRLQADDLITYLHSTISTHNFEIAAGELPIFLDRFLPDQEFIGGFFPRLNDNHLRVIGIRQLIGPTQPGLFSALNNLPYEYRTMARFVALDNQTAASEIGKIGRYWFQKKTNIVSAIFSNLTGDTPKENSDALRRADDADNAVDQLSENHASFGYTTLSIAITHKDPLIADKRATEIAELVRRARCLPIIESVNAVEAWLGMVPGNSVANVRRPLLSSVHFSHMIPISGAWAGPDGIKHDQLTGPPHITCKTASSTPFRFTTYVEDVGHFLVVGPTGGGKSTLLNLLIPQWLKYKNSVGPAQVFGIESGASMRCMVRALDGTFHNLSGEGSTLALQPLRHVDSLENREWATNWITRLLQNAKFIVSSEQRQEIWDALSALAEQRPANRIMSVFQNMLQDKAMRDAISTYTVDGPAGRYLDNVSITKPSQIEVIELGDIITTDYAAPILDALFNRFEMAFDGRPTLLIIDEAWLPLLNSNFLARLQMWLKTLRKKNVAVGLATQQIGDLLNSEAADTIFNACPTHIFLPNAAVSQPDVQQKYRAIGLNDRQIEIIQTAQPKRDYYYTSPQGSRLIDFELTDLGLVLCTSTSSSDQKLMDRMDPNDDGPTFAYKWLDLKNNSLNAYPDHFQVAAE